MNVLIWTAALVAVLTIADTATGTAWWQQQRGNTMFTPDHFDIFADDDNADGLDDIIAATLSIPGLRLAADEMTTFAILTDAELADIDADIDNGVYDTDDDTWFLATFHADSLAALEADERLANDRDY